MYSYIYAKIRISSCFRHLASAPACNHGCVLAFQKPEVAVVSAWNGPVNWSISSVTSHLRMLWLIMWPTGELAHLNLARCKCSVLIGSFSMFPAKIITTSLIEKERLFWRNDILTSSEVPKRPNISHSAIFIQFANSDLSWFFFNYTPVPRPSLTLSLTAFLPP